MGKLLSAQTTSLCFHYKLPSRIVVVKEGEKIWVFGVRVWFKREKGIWGVWFGSREKKGFGGFGSKREEGI